MLSVASSVGTSTVLVVPNSFVFSLGFLQLKEEKSLTVQSCSWRKMSYELNKHRYSLCFLICWFSGLAAKLKFILSVSNLAAGIAGEPFVILNLFTFQLSNSIKGEFMLS